MNYLSPNDSLAFLDHVKKEPTKTFTKECKVCKGYGGWNLKPYSYSLPHLMDNTAENRYKFVHFRTNCPNCFGWGYTEKSHNCKGHQWTIIETIDNCLHIEKCINCGEEIQVDSGD